MCLAAVGLMGDMCRALGLKILPYCDETMVILLENLGVSGFFYQLLHFSIFFLVKLSRFDLLDSVQNFCLFNESLQLRDYM